MAAQLKTHARTISELSDQFTWQKKVSTVILLHWEKKSTLSADSAEEKLKNQKAEMLNNFAEVAVSRVTDQLTTDLIKAASQDVANVMQHKCDGMTFFFLLFYSDDPKCFIMGLKLVWIRILIPLPHDFTT